MKIKIEVVIYIYISVCICMVIFNCFVIIHKRYKHLITGRRSGTIKNIVSIQLIQLGLDRPIIQPLQDTLAKRLTKLRHLLAFNDAVNFFIEEGNPFIFKYLDICRPIFSYLAIKYQEKSNMHKAYFCYLMSQYKLSKNMSYDIITDVMLSFVTSSSIYCRENALRAIYSFGNPESVVKAILLIAQNKLFHSPKLIADGLASFEGDHTQLTALLWEHFDQLNSEMQVAIVNYIKMVSDAYCSPFYERLTGPKTDKEVKLAILRYFRKYYYAPVQQQLISFLLLEDEYDWEFSAVAALALQNYPGDQTIDALKKSLHSTNWYVRSNAVQSLKVFQIREVQL